MIVLVTTFSEDIQALQRLLGGQLGASFLLDSFSTLRQQLGQLSAHPPFVLLCSLDAEDQRFQILLSWLCQDESFSQVPKLLILNKGQSEHVRHMEQPHLRFLERPVPQKLLLRTIRELQSEHLQLSSASVTENDADLAMFDAGYKMRRFQEANQSVVLEKVLGRGGAGTVFLGYQRSLRRKVAVKILGIKSLGSMHQKERLQQEALAIASLRDPHIVQCYDADFIEDELFYIIMEFLPGEDLEFLLHKFGAFDEHDAIDIVWQTAKGLLEAHNHNLIHRDIKPSNLIRNAGGHVTITDFGLAKSMTTGKLTREGVVVGTPYYLSPEQALDHPLDQRTDIYSLGVVFYELLTGVLPCHATNAFESVANRLKLPFLDPRLDAPHVSDEVAEVIAWMTQLDPEERCPSCFELLQVLEPLYAPHTFYFSQSALLTSSSQGSSSVPTLQLSSGHTPRQTSVPPSVRDAFLSSSGSHSRLLRPTPDVFSRSIFSDSSDAFGVVEQRREERAERERAEREREREEQEIAKALAAALSKTKAADSQVQAGETMRPGERQGGPFPSEGPSFSSKESGAFSHSTSSPPRPTRRLTEFELLMKDAQRAYIQRDLQRALELFRRCAELEPENRLVKSNIEKLEKRIGVS